jgi:hypothetical protein
MLEVDVVTDLGSDYINPNLNLNYEGGETISDPVSVVWWNFSSAA